MAQEATVSVGLGGLLGILFIGLKLTHQIDWSWWWVLCPFWGPTVFVLGVYIIAFIVVLMGSVTK